MFSATISGKSQNLFGGKTPMAQRFTIAEWGATETGAPRLEGALIAFECVIASAVDVGTHAVLICEVVAIHEGRGRNALHSGRAYHGLRTADSRPSEAAEK